MNKQVVFGIIVLFVLATGLAGYMFMKNDQSTEAVQQDQNECPLQEWVASPQIDIAFAGFEPQALRHIRVEQVRAGSIADTFRLNNGDTAEQFLSITNRKIKRSDSLVLTLQDGSEYVISSFENRFEEHYGMFGKLAGGDCRFAGASVNGVRDEDGPVVHIRKLK